MELGSTQPALQVRGLTKRYDDGTLALDGLDLEVPAGSFFGLLGPNGAGKTTLISAVCNLIRVTDGEVMVFGAAQLPGGAAPDRHLRAGAEPGPLPDACARRCSTTAAITGWTRRRPRSGPSR